METKSTKAARRTPPRRRFWRSDTRVALRRVATRPVRSCERSIERSREHVDDAHGSQTQAGEAGPRTETRYLSIPVCT